MYQNLKNMRRMILNLVDSNDIKNNFKGGPLAFESAKTTYLKNLDMFKSLNKKKLIFEEDKDDTSLLDEKQLKK
jgi:hypothetical protein